MADADDKRAALKATVTEIEALRWRAAHEGLDFLAFQLGMAGDEAENELRKLGAEVVRLRCRDSRPRLIAGLAGTALHGRSAPHSPANSLAGRGLSSSRSANPSDVATPSIFECWNDRGK